MIGVQIDNTFAELNDDTTIGVELFNPIFNDGDIIKGSSTMPFNLPGAEKSEVNSRLFKNPDVIGNVESFKSIASKLFFGGVPWKSGLLRAKGYDKSVIQANYIFGISTIADNIKTAKLRDIITGQSNTYIQTTLTKGFYIKNNVAFPLKLKVNGREISAVSLANLQGLINQNENETKVSASLSVAGSTPGGAAHPYMFVTVNTLLGGDNHDPAWPISVEPIEDTEVEKAKWYIEPFAMTDYNDAIRDFVDPGVNAVLFFPTLFNPGLYGEASNPKPNDIVNGKNGSGFLLNTIENGTWIVNNRNSIHPFLKVKFVLDQIANEFDIDFEGDWYEDPNTAKMLLDNMTCLDVSMPYIGSKNFVFCRRTFNLSDLVPDVSVVSFLKSLQNRYNLAIYQNEKNGKITIKKRGPVAEATTYNDITSISGPVVPIEDQRLTGIRLKAATDPDDGFVQVDEYTVGVAEDEIKTDISGLRNEFTTGQLDGEDGNVTGPYIRKKIGSKFTFRIFYYLGDVDNGNFVYQGASVNASGYDEKFDGVNGLYEKNWKSWLHKRINRQVLTIDVDFPFRILREVEWDVKSRFDRSNFIIYSISVQLTMKRVTISRVKLYTF
jgi:hypothetical protein